ncbi:MAG: thioredoxin domain-containing protein [Candidatus Sericytochromatia bacterium]|nr:MAG: thioredoxin domain-containing protein [Candidatus Sericytochromatia bacterium]
MKANKLINETSPYLLQHAYNPVNWYPWCEEAFEIAKKEDKPVFLSVGYSACHWCHVMEKESFEDEETAEIMNKLFVNIKVDREERPDIDTIYMNFVQLLTGHGGWPMSVFMTPDKEPFYGGTYFPKNRKYYMPSFKEVLISVSKSYYEKKQDILKSTSYIIKNLNVLNKFNIDNDFVMNRNVIDNAIKKIEDYFDYKNGGFGDKPKFPNTFNLDLLLKEYIYSSNKKYLDMVELTLKKMCNGGIYDQLGGGFYRYSVDETWTIPHYEKMLYDNALLIKLLLETYQITNNEFYKNKAIQSLDYIKREMLSPEGGFYSSQDADSEGEEGKFYTWTYQEILNILGDEKGKIFCNYFDITEQGNFEHGKSNLQILYSDEEISKKFSISLEELKNLIENLKNILFEVRKKRAEPNKDTKIINSWNSLMISTFIKAYEVLKNEDYLNIAKNAISFILNKLNKDNKLIRTYKDNISKYDAYLEDYAFLISALIDLHQIGEDNFYLKKAIELNNFLIENFWDNKESGFFFNSRYHEELIVRTKEITDHSIPSGNSVSFYNLIRLSRILDDKNLENLAIKILKLFSETIKKYPLGVSSLLYYSYILVNPPKDIVISAKTINEIKKARLKINNYYADTIFHFNYESNDLKNNFMIKDKQITDNKVAIYTCENFTCKKEYFLNIFDDL